MRRLAGDTMFMTRVPDARVLGWVVFVGDTPAIIESHLADSLTDDAAGKWTVVWARAVSASTQYAVMGVTRRLGTNAACAIPSVQFPSYVTTTSVPVSACESSGNTAVDVDYFSVIAVGAA